MSIAETSNREPPSKRKEKNWMDKIESLNHTKWGCKYHFVFIPKNRRKVLYGQLRAHLGEVFRGLA
jgi:putative transposase